MESKVKDIVKAMEILAPPVLKESFDNVGLMVGSTDKVIKKVLLALDCTTKVIQEAKEKSVDMIITHHPLLFRKPSRIVKEDLMGNKIFDLIKSDIALYSSHTNLDSVKGGINDEIIRVLGFEKGKLIEPVRVLGYDDCGLGRIVKLQKEMLLEEVVQLVKDKLGIESLRVVEGNKNVSKIAVINGSGQDYISKAVQRGADCIITGDTTYHFASDYKEMGISIIDAGHFATEWYVFLKVMKKIEEQFNNVDFIISQESKDPYTFY